MSAVVVAGDTSGAITIQAPADAGNVTLTLPIVAGTLLSASSLGTSGQVLTSSGLAGPVWSTSTSGGAVLGAALTSPFAPTSAVNFNAIPLATKRIVISYTNLSTTGTANIILRIGSGAYDATGYLGSVSGSDSVSGLVAVAETTGFRLSNTTAAASVKHGAITLTHMGSNIWVATGITAHSNAANIFYTAGTKTLSGQITQLQLTTANAPTDTFDSGTVNIMYEL